MGTLTLNRNGLDLSLLEPGKYQLLFPHIPQTAFYCQSVNIPGISFGTAIAAFDALDVKLPGEKLVFESLRASILVDKNLSQWYEMYNWLLNISVLGGATDTTSQAMIMIGSLLYTFEGIYPTSLTGFELVSNLTDVPPVTFNVTFEFVKMVVKLQD